MSASPPLSPTSPAITVDVQIVGVIGCSASGKSTAAHQLAQCLRSPLHPISTDQFFFDDVCATLGTYDDYRCLDYAKITHWMQVMKKPFTCKVSELFAEGNALRQEVVEAEVLKTWCAQLASCLPDIASYVRLSAKAPEEKHVESLTPLTKQPSRNTAAEAEDRNGVLEKISTSTEGQHENGNGGEEEDDEDDDASLCAHEAEELERRAQAIFSSPLPDSSPHPSKATCGATLPLSGSQASSLQHFTVYVIWEGFTLLCSDAVNACIDYAVQVRCDAETACLRRFFRSPRRHLIQHAIQPLAEKSSSDDDAEEDAGPAITKTEGDEEVSDKRQVLTKRREARRRDRAAVVARVVRQLYRPRIEQMWAVRARTAQRSALYDALQHEMQLLEGDDAAAAVSRQANASFESVAHLLQAHVYNPPRPQTLSCAASTGESTVDVSCWTPNGIPTHAFQHFWEEEFGQWLRLQSDAAVVHALSWAALDASQEEENHNTQGVSSIEGVSKETFYTIKQHRSPVSSMSTMQNHVDQTQELLTGKAYVERVLADRGLKALLDVPRQISNGAATVSSSSSSREAATVAARRTEESEVPSASLVAKALAPFYYEFRYWFFFEVLYYDRLVSPLQAHRLRHRFVRVSDGGKAAHLFEEENERLWWVMENGQTAQGKVEENLRRQVQQIANSIQEKRRKMLVPAH